MKNKPLILCFIAGTLIWSLLPGPHRICAEMIVAESNEEGKPLEEHIVDGEGNLMIGPDGYAVIRREYDDGGRQISEAYFDVEGKPVLSRGEGLCRHHP